MPGLFASKTGPKTHCKSLLRELLLTRCETFHSGLGSLETPFYMSLSLADVCQNRHAEPEWHRLQTEKSSPPKAR